MGLAGWRVRSRSFETSLMLNLCTSYTLKVDGICSLVEFLLASGNALAYMVELESASLF